MCLEDISIARNLKVNVYDCSRNATLDIPANPNRISLRLTVRNDGTTPADFYNSEVVAFNSAGQNQVSNSQVILSVYRQIFFDAVSGSGSADSKLSDYVDIHMIGDGIKAALQIITLNFDSTWLYETYLDVLGPRLPNNQQLT